MRAGSSSRLRPLLLLVDDHHQIRQLVSGIGSRGGFEVLEAADGAAAIAARRLGIGRRARYRLIDKYGEKRA